MKRIGAESEYTECNIDVLQPFLNSDDVSFIFSAIDKRLLFPKYGRTFLLELQEVISSGLKTLLC